MTDVLIKRDTLTLKETTGSLWVPDKDFKCLTLELGWHENQNNISCIPSGQYPCKFTRSTRLSKLKGKDFYTYEVLNVPMRAGIRIHSANFFYSLLGCIALGEGFTDMDKDGEVDLTNSRATIDKFNAVMNREDFQLTIS